MSQMLVPRTDARKILFQELYFTKKRTPVRSTAEAVVCVICNEGLDEGVSVTAKRVGKLTKFFCRYHFPNDF